MRQRPLLLLTLLLCYLMSLNVARSFDYRRHLATKTRYAFKAPIPGAPSVYSVPDPEGFEPIHLWLVSRHGTRWPTPSRMAQINSLRRLFKDANNTGQHPWVRSWESPVQQLQMAGGDLHAIGEDEMWALARRLRSRFPSLASAPYYPKRHNVVSTQVARAAASASAFASGFFPTIEPSLDEAHAHARAALLAARSMEAGANPNSNPNPSRNPSPNPAVGGSQDGTAAGGAGDRVQPCGTGAAGDLQICELDLALDLGLDLGLGSPLTPSEAALARTLTQHASGRGASRPQPVAITQSPKHQDPLLRFFDMCPAYEVHEERTEEWLSGWMAGKWGVLLPRLEARLGVRRGMEPCEVQALWQLCLLEAGIHNDTSKACSLFAPTEVALLEWMDDVGLYEQHGYGAPLNYEIATPLLADLVQTLKAVASEQEPLLKSRLLFAHCETLIPLVSLMGLFRNQTVDQLDGFRSGGFGAAVSGAGQGAGAAAKLASQELLAKEFGEELAGSWAAKIGSAQVGDETSETCYKAKAVGGAPPPKGWSPSVPFDDARMWRGARLGPYGANMAVVLYRAKGGGSSASHRVRLVYNEQVVQLPGSFPDASLDVSLEEFVERYATLADAGIMTRICAGDDGKNGTSGVGGGGRSGPAAAAG